MLYGQFQNPKQESGWCSGYHARFTRERSRVRTSHPIFFYFFLFLEVPDFWHSKKRTVDTTESGLSTPRRF